MTAEAYDELVIQELFPSLVTELDEHVQTIGSHCNLMVKKIVGHAMWPCERNTTAKCST